MTAEAIDAVLIINGYNSRYLSGFTGSSSYLYISHSKKVLMTDFRYIEQARKQCPEFEVIDYISVGLDNVLSELCGDEHIKVLGLEEHLMTHREYQFVTEHLGELEFYNLECVVEKLRWIKDKDELGFIEEAAQIADSAFEHILKYIKPGVMEWDIAIELEYYMKKNGATALSFPTIVASGTRSSLPHGRASHKYIKEGEFVTLDFGCIFKGYCSDMTRTVVVGKATDEQKSIYKTVLNAQMKALEAIKAGLSGKEIDKIARDYIDGTQYKGRFGHGLGHSVGLDVHETPRLSTRGFGLLEEDMVLTVEPGIYIPDYGGVRIEDLVVVKKDDCVNLTKSTKSLLEL